jgi:hypothetical protein
MKTLIGALTVGAILIGASSLSWAADVQHRRQPKHDDPERLRMIRECMAIHHFIQAATSASTAPAWPTVATMDNRKRV